MANYFQKKATDLGNSAKKNVNNLTSSVSQIGQTGAPSQPQVAAPKVNLPSTQVPKTPEEAFDTYKDWTKFMYDPFGVGDRIARDTGFNPYDPLKGGQVLKDIGGVGNRISGAISGDYIDAPIKNMTQLAKDQGVQTQGQLDKLAGSSNQYVQGLGANRDEFVKEIGNVTNQYNDSTRNKIRQSADEAKATRDAYYNNIDPALGTLQNRAMNNAGQAMSVSDAGNVNNTVQQGVRGLYGQEEEKVGQRYGGEGEWARRQGDQEGARARGQYAGEGQSQADAYEQKAQGIGRQGLAAAGQLAALGGQAMRSQLGGTPMTGAQLAAMQGASMRGASDAYGRAQGQMANLRQQGMDRQMDLRGQGLGVETQSRAMGLGRQSDANMQGLAATGNIGLQGIGAGLNQSNAVFGMGQDAQSLASGLTTTRQNAGLANQQAGMAARGEQAGYDTGLYNAGQDYAGNVYGAGNDVTNAAQNVARDNAMLNIAKIGAEFGGLTAAQLAELQAKGGHNAAIASALSGIGGPAAAAGIAAI